MRISRRTLAVGTLFLTGLTATSALADGRPASRIATFAEEPQPIAAPAAAARDRALVYAGATRNDEPLVLWANAKATKLTGAAVTFNVTCPSGNTWPIFGDPSVRPLPSGDAIPMGVLLAKVNAKRRFEMSLLGDLPAVEPYGVMFLMSLKGTRDARTARGTLEAFVTVTDTQTGALLETCMMEPLKWTAAHRPGRVYGGISRQHEPVAVTLNARRTKVEELRFGWFAAPCSQPETLLNYGDLLLDFPLRRGRFGDVFSETFPRDDGGSNTWSYDISGKVSKSKASGSYTASVTYNEPDGSTLTCSVPATRWSATSR